MADREPAAENTGAIRLLFAYEGSEIRLVDREHVDMFAPPGEPQPIRKRAAGFWVELRDERGRRLYQQALRHPIRYEAEVFPEDQSEQPHYVPRERVEGAFVVLVPDLPKAYVAALFGSPPEPGRAGEPATELLEVPLRPRPRQRGGDR